MTSLTEATVLVDFPLYLTDPTGYFVLDESVLDGSDVLGGPVETDISAYAWDVVINRGRARTVDEFRTGTCTVQLRNHTRYFDPVFSSADDDHELTLEDGSGVLLLENGDSLLLESDPVDSPLGKIQPGLAVRIKAGDAVLFTGTIEDWDYQWRPDNDGKYTTSFTAVDALGELSRRSLSAHTASKAQLPGARVRSVLNRKEVNWSATARDIDTGVFPLVADEVAEGTNALAYLQTVARSDDGRVFADVSGNVVFRDRHSTAATTAPIITFSDDSTIGFPFQALDVLFGTELLYTRVVIDKPAAGETSQGWYTDSVTVDDKPAQQLDGYGIRSYNKSGLLMRRKADALALANHWLEEFSTPEAYVSRLKFTADIASYGTGDSGTDNYAYTGAVQTFTVPQGVTSITVTAVGSAGGGHASISEEHGRGHSITATFDVTPSTVYDVYVGGIGTSDVYANRDDTGGWPNGGNGGYPWNVGGDYGGWGGGGATFLVPQGGTIADALIVGAGGGGTAEQVADRNTYAEGVGAGNGGYAAGTDGRDHDGGTDHDSAEANGGEAGTASAGGAGGTGDTSNGQDGDTDGQGVGGRGGDSASSYTSPGGGGGGGWHGGGGGGQGGSGSANTADGAGGSSYVAATGSDIVDNGVGSQNTAGSMSISYTEDAGVTVRGIDFGDLVRVVWTPTGSGGQFDQWLIVEGIRHSFRVGNPHWTELALSDRTGGPFFILDDATYGVLDSSRLGF